jgi:glycosyltransferase involved in cell wall biosynthesis
VVDGGSKDSTINKVRKVKKTKILINKKCSPASSMNMGAKIAKGDIIFFSGSDCIIDSKNLEFHVRAYERISSIVGVMGTLRRIGQRTRVSEFIQQRIMSSEWLSNLNQDGTITSYIGGANFSLKKTCFQKNRFNTKLNSLEDTELFIRLKRKKLKIFYEPRAVVYHKHPQTIQQLFKRYMWYGEGIWHVDKIHKKYFANRYSLFSPKRYIAMSKSYLQKAVTSDNRLLCKNCSLNSIQQCEIDNPDILKNNNHSYLLLHKIICLAIASGILKQRTGINFTTVSKEYFDH